MDGVVLTSEVAIVVFGEKKPESEALKQALSLIGGIEDLKTANNSVTVKVGVFSHKVGNHSSVDLVKAIVDNFDMASKIFLAESDNYQGTSLERLQIWKELFTEKIVPFNLSDDSDARTVTLAEQDMSLSHILFKPNVLVSTHILRSFERGSILKNLFGCVPTSKKAKFHKVLPRLLADIYEAVGGIDLAVLDGTYFWQGAGNNPVPMNTLVVGRDAVAVETVGATLVGLVPEKMPVIQEFVRRNLGEGDLENIKIVGSSVEHLKEKFLSAAKTQRKLQAQRKGPQTWGGHSHQAFESLIQEGFFKLPKKRTIEDVTRALEAKGLPAKGNKSKIADSLARRVNKGVLKKAKGHDGWTYWTE